MDALLLLQLFSPTAVKSKCSYALSEMSYYYDLKIKPEVFGVLNRIMRDRET
jgi:hypothetical protein